jgi:creatinine amidohydrolase/Fe(II)-dependent formamide hydrolase-like protein
VSDSGVLGDPSRASAQHGRQLRERWCAEVVSMIDEMDGLA